MQTRREKIAELIKKQDLTPSEIAKFLDISVKTVIEDLQHIALSKKYGKMLIMPARCRKCGYEFKPEIKLPKKCPRCKSQWIDEPRFMLED